MCFRAGVSCSGRFASFPLTLRPTAVSEPERPATTLPISAVCRSSRWSRKWATSSLCPLCAWMCVWCTPSARLSSPLTSSHIPSSPSGEEGWSGLASLLSLPSTAREACRGYEASRGCRAWESFVSTYQCTPLLSGGSGSLSWRNCGVGITGKGWVAVSCFML